MNEDLAVLNKQAIAAAQRYMGHFAPLTVFFSAAVVLLYIVNLILTVTGVLPLWIGAVLFAVLTYMSYTPVHEAAHDNIHGKRAELRWVNDLCGFACAQLIMIPYSTHTVEHFTHHRYTNQPDKDPDYVVKDMGEGVLPFLTVAARFLWTQVTFLFHGYWASASLKEKAIFWGELGGALAWRVALLAVMPFGMWLTLIVGSYAVGVLFTMYWFAYRPHHPYEDPTRYRNTNSLIAPDWLKLVEWFWLGQNLHSIHHAFPRVPFYKYHALFREIEPIMRAHGNPVLGMFDRQPVPEQYSTKGVAY